MAVLDRQGIPEDLLKRTEESEAQFKKPLWKLKAFSPVLATKSKLFLACIDWCNSQLKCGSSYIKKYIYMRRKH
jgi:hypothetical protein